MQLRNLELLVLALAAVPLSAQVGTSVLTGRVMDATGAAIPHATLKVVNEESGWTLTVVTNPEGIYRAPALLPGAYRVQLEAPGFQPQVRRKIGIAVAQVSALDFTLQVGQQNLSVEVSADLPPVDTQTSSIAQLVDHKMIDNLPIPNRAASALVNLSPGVVMINSGEGAENYPVFSMAGGRARNQDFTLDGGNVTNAVGVTRPQQQTSLPLDAMQEFRVISNNYAAEHGHSTGGIVAMSTRSGTNEFHGSIFEFGRNSALDARNFFSRTIPPLNLHQFGGSLGGPVVRDKTHFFTSWEETREAFGSASVLTVPTLPRRAGDFSRSGSLVYDPATLAGGKKQPYPGNIIPQSQLDPVAVKTLDYMPLPNRTPSAGTSSNFGANSHSALRRDIVLGKLDHQLTRKDQLTARYYINDYRQEDDGSYGMPVSDPNAGTTDGRVQSMMISHLHTFGPTLLNNLQVSYDRRSYLQRRFGMGQGVAQSLGLANVSAAAFPTFNINGYALLGAQGTANAAVARIQAPITDTQILESVSRFAGKHAFKAGLEYRRGYNREVDDIASSGNLAFTRQITGQPGVSGTGDAFASFLIGQANQASLQNLDSIPSHASYWAAYLQDDYRVGNRLTLNLGLRWEVEMPRYVDHNRMNAFDRNSINPVSGTPGIVTFAGVNGVPRTAFDPNYANVGPRFGFAYNPVKNLAIRGGAGIFYGPMVSNSVGPAAPLGFSDNLSLVAPSPDTTAALTLRNGFPLYVRPPLTTPGFGAVPYGAKPNTAVTFFDRNRPTPTSYQVNLDVQDEVLSGLVLEAGYIGNVSHHLTANDLSINQVPPGSMGPGNSQWLRPFPQFSNVSIINPPVGNSNYQAGFVKVERRFRHDFQVLAHYTFSKFLDDVASGNELGDPGSYMDAYNRRLDKGRSGSDIPHRAVLSFLYAVPAFERQRLVSAVLGGWQLGVFSNLQSGQTFTVYDSANATNAFPAGTVRPNLVGDPMGGTQSLTHWFNTAAFQSAPAFTFGDSPRSVLRGPAWKSADLTVSKNFKLTERWTTELRGEFFNVINHANFDVPGHTLGNADFGVISSAEAARTLQIALRVAF
ncbi:MAG TPA: carboxypeptidase regulatory-like domain-containing protein [Bryobacteraceae bacterium]|nr:carboxypeptidase regulatory-like domain-containing protein [Bryobacteraceae bacterium]